MANDTDDLTSKDPELSSCPQDNDDDQKPVNKDCSSQNEEKDEIEDKTAHENHSSTESKEEAESETDCKDHTSTDSEPKNTEGTNDTPKKDHVYYVPLSQATIRGDWEAAEKFLHNDPSALTAEIIESATILHLAISTGQSEQFVKELINLMLKENKSLAIPCNYIDDTPLHRAAAVGNTRAAKILVEKDPSLTQKRNSIDLIPLHYAAEYGHKETTQYLLTRTQDEDPNPFKGESGGILMFSVLVADFYDIALDLLKRYPNLAIEKQGGGQSPLYVLASKFRAFPSGSNLGFFQCLIYKIMAGYIDAQNVTQHGDVENPGGSSEECPKKTWLYELVPNTYDRILKYKQVIQLLKVLICEVVKHDEGTVDDILGVSVRRAASTGISELVLEAIKAYPSSVTLSNDDWQSVFGLSVLYRREKVFNLIYQMSPYKLLIQNSKDKEGNNMLHLAAKLVPSDRISGAALQMQRELQWFKAVEDLVKPSNKEIVNKSNLYPREMFTKEHKDLVKEGEKWMYKTASSYALVATLVVTVAFAAVFTAPGGTVENKGIPIILKERSFMIFAISNALALFSSATSLLMFLGILTSRYSEEDFLWALPMRLSIGLITLFFSIAAMLAAFSSALYILVSHQVNWIAVPIGLIACVPVGLFAILQFPLLVEIVYSTFGPTIFCKQSDEIIM